MIVTRSDFKPLFSPESGSRVIPQDKSFYTFDFFDTLFHRSAGHWLEFYRQLGSFYADLKVIPDGADVLEMFVAERVLSEERAREKSHRRFGHREVRLLDVYLEFCQAFPFSDLVSAQKLADIEFAEDARLLVPNFKLMQEVSCLESGYAVVSDTFYSSAQLQSVLDRYGLKPEFVLSSCEHDDGKYGGLFEILVSKLQRAGSALDVIHIGDNYHSDFVKPVEYGLEALHIPYGDTLFWKREQLARDWLTEYFGEPAVNKPPVMRMVAATSQGLGVVIDSKLSFDDISHYSYGYRNLGPLIVGFSIWISDLVERLNAQALLFLMREGDLLHSAHQTLFDDSRLISKKFFISRKVAAQSSIFTGSTEELKKLNFNSSTQSLYEYLQLIGIKDTRSIAFLEDNLPGGLAAPCSSYLESVIDLVQNNGFLLDEVLSHSRIMRAGLLCHLKTLVAPMELSDMSRIVIADVGWNGTIQKFLNCIFQACPEYAHIKVVGAYILTTAAAPENSVGFLGSRGFPSKAAGLFMRSPEIIEQCTSSTEYGTTIGYQNDGQPLTKTVTNSSQLEDIHAVQQGIMGFAKFAKSYISNLKEEAGSQSLKDWLFSHLLRQTCMPLPAESNLFASWCHDDNLLKDDIIPVCSTGLEEWFRFAPLRLLSKVRMDECYWIYPLLRERFICPHEFFDLFRASGVLDDGTTSCHEHGLVVIGGLNYRHCSSIQSARDSSGRMFVHSSLSFAARTMPYRVSLSLDPEIDGPLKITYLCLHVKSRLGQTVTSHSDESNLRNLFRKNRVVISSLSGEPGANKNLVYRKLSHKHGGIVLGPSIVNWSLEAADHASTDCRSDWESKVSSLTLDESFMAVDFRMILSPFQ